MSKISNSIKNRKTQYRFQKKTLMIKSYNYIDKSKKNMLFM